MKQLKRKKKTKEMSSNEQFKINWQNKYLESIGYFVPIISLKKLFN